MRCIELAIENPPARGERVRIFNQMTEVHRVIDLAELVSRITGADVDLLDNPRKEAARERPRSPRTDSSSTSASSRSRLEDDLLREVTEIARQLQHRCDRDKIPCRSRWVQDRPALPDTDAASETVVG